MATKDTTDGSEMRNEVAESVLVDTTTQAILHETTTRGLASLTARKERVLRMRFGIGKNTVHTFEEVGQAFAATRERIRQIEARILENPKRP